MISPEANSLATVWHASLDKGKLARKRSPAAGIDCNCILTTWTKNTQITTSTPNPSCPRDLLVQNGMLPKVHESCRYSVLGRSVCIRNPSSDCFGDRRARRESGVNPIAPLRGRAPQPADRQIPPPPPRAAAYKPPPSLEYAHLSRTPHHNLRKERNFDFKDGCSTGFASGDLCGGRSRQFQ